MGITIKEEYLPILNMDPIDKEKGKHAEEAEEIMRIRVQLKGREVKHLEEACNEMITRVKNKDFETIGPVRIPTKILRITTRKSPCGEGTNTWDRYEMRIHKRVIDIMCPSSVVKDITTFKIDSSVDVDLVVLR